MSQTLDAPATGLTQLVTTAVPLPIDHVDTDQIIAARFLKGTQKTGLGQHLFYDLRHNADGSQKPEFPLHLPQYQGAKVLVAGENFGCGSSREHAPWALRDWGFQAIIAISFADIFRNNALKNGLVPIVLPEDTVRALLTQLVDAPQTPIALDVLAQTLTIGDASAHPFDIPPFYKTCITQGVDEIGFSLGQLDSIRAYEAGRE